MIASQAGDNQDRKDFVLWEVLSDSRKGFWFTSVALRRYPLYGRAGLEQAHFRGFVCSGFFTDQDVVGMMTAIANSLCELFREPQDDNLVDVIGNKVSL